MTPEEKLINIIRMEGSRKNTPALTLGEMISKNQCQVGENILEADDLYIAEHLVNAYEVAITLDAVPAYISTQASSTPVWIKNQKATVQNSLKKGDVVLLYPISTEKYVIIEKVVSL
mgnify:CR=1 FL=1